MYKKILFILILPFILVACGEKHDGLRFCYNKCEASLNGVALIDQQPIGAAFAPDALPPTPNIEFQRAFNFGGDSYTMGHGTFQTRLSDKRAGDTKYYVKIQIPCEAYDEFISTDVEFEKYETGDAGSTAVSYLNYCGKHSLPAAIVNAEIATDCKFKFTTYDAKRCLWNGEFIINFSEGELSGKFSVYDFQINH